MLQTFSTLVSTIEKLKINSGHTFPADSVSEIKKHIYRVTNCSVTVLNGCTSERDKHWLQLFIKLPQKLTTMHQQKTNSKTAGQFSALYNFPLLLAFIQSHEAEFSASFKALCRARLGAFKAPCLSAGFGTEKASCSLRIWLTNSAQPGPRQLACIQTGEQTVLCILLMCFQGYSCIYPSEYPLCLVLFCSVVMFSMLSCVYCRNDCEGLE